MTLTPFSRSQEGLDCWKMGIASCPHSISLLNGHILAKLTQIYHWEGGKCWLDFGDLDPIFKVTLGLRLLENALSVSWRNGWILTKLAQPNCCGMENNWLYFGDLDPIFKVAGELRLLDNGLSACYLLNEWMNFNQTCTATMLRHEKELITFWWPWPYFQGHGRA